MLNMPTVELRPPFAARHFFFVPLLSFWSSQDYTGEILVKEPNPQLLKCFKVVHKVIVQRSRGPCRAVRLYLNCSVYVFFFTWVSSRATKARGSACSSSTLVHFPDRLKLEVSLLQVYIIMLSCFFFLTLSKRATRARGSARSSRV